MIMPRPVFILYRVAEMTVSLISRFINAAFLGGSTHQTTSARMYIEQWPKGQKIVNTLFFWQTTPKHCEWAWRREVKEAQKTLERAKNKARK